MKRVISVWLQPQPRLKIEIFGIIKTFSRKYKVYSDLNGYKGPHISILEIHGNKHDFKTVVKMIKDTSSGTKPFRLWINGVGYFMKKDETGKRNFVIYLKVKSSKQLIKFKHEIDNEFPREYLRHKDRKFVPHITITHRELDKENFYKALKEYKNLDFIRNFTVDRVMVSTRNVKTQKAKIKSITFRN